MKRREALKNSALLAGCGLSIGSITALIQGCKQENISMHSGELLDLNQIEMISQIVEIIIPETDTPGAISAGVPHDLYDSLKDSFTQEDQNRFVKGLKSIDIVANKTHDSNFVNLDSNEQIKLLTNIAKSEEKQNIFNTLKALTVYLFFTSEKGAKEVLKYDPIPGGYDECIDYSEINGAWALS